MTEDERSALAESLLALQTKATGLVDDIAQARADFYAYEPPPEVDPPVNEPPVFISPAAVTVRENTTAVVTLAVNDPEGDSVTFAISGGSDRALFSLTGADLAFKAAPDFEAPGDKVYLVEVTATDAAGGTATQNLTVTVTNDPADDEPNPEPEEPLPEDGNKIRVADGAALTKILSGPIAPLTVLALASGVGKFPGTYTIRASGRSVTQPIFVVGEQAHVGKRTGISGKFIAVGSYIKFTGFDFTGAGNKVEIRNRGTRVNRCRFTGINYDGIIYLRSATGASVTPDTQIDRCEFRNIAGAAIRSELRDLGQNKGIRIERNLFSGHTPLGDNESVVLILTDSFFVSDTGGIRYHRNIFENCLQNNTVGQKEIISVKTGSALISENTVINTDGFLCLRESNYSRVVGNWMDRKAYIKVFGDDHVIVNNFGEDKVVELNRGQAWSTKVVPAQCRSFGKAGRSTVIWDGRCKGAHCGTRRAKVEHNIGRVVIGDKNQERYGYTYNCQSLKLRFNAKKAERIPADGYPDTVEADIGATVNTAKKLTAADVGILA